MSIIGTFSPGSIIESREIDNIQELLNQLPDNSQNLIDPSDIRDSIYTLWEKTESISASSASASSYQNTDIVPVTVGGIDAGSVFSTPRNMQEMWDLLLYPELTGSLTNPSSSFISNQTGLKEVGVVINISFSSNFNRGSINPQYDSTEPFRSGLPNSYEYTGISISGVYNSTSLIDSQNITGYEVVLGNQTWTGRVNYDLGVQPVSNKGNNYNAPLPAGSTNFVNRTITGVYPFFATSVSITILTQQALAVHNSQFFQFDLQSDSGLNRQTFEIPYAFSPITGVQQFNTISQTWEFIGGYKSGSLSFSQFIPTSINKIINSYSVTYIQYVYDGPIVGFRQIRLYTN